jgi:hypothetical protein
VPLSSPGPPMRVFRPVVQIPTRPVPDSGQHGAVRDAGAAQAVGDDVARLVAQPLQQPLEGAVGGGGISLVLDEDVEHDAGLVDGTPEVVKLTVDPDEHVVQVPYVDKASMPVSGVGTRRDDNCGRFQAARLKRLPMFRTCPFLIITIASKPANVRSAVCKLPKPRPDQPFDPPVILLNEVVEVFALPKPREAPQLTAPLHLARRSRVGRVLVDGTGARVRGMDLCQGLAEESFGGCGVPPSGKTEVDRPTEAVHGAIQVTARPASLHEAEPGGLGLVLIRHYCRDISYERIGNRNRLTLRLSVLLTQNIAV